MEVLAELPLVIHIIVLLILEKCIIEGRKEWSTLYLP